MMFPHMMSLQSLEGACVIIALNLPRADLIVALGRSQGHVLSQSLVQESLLGGGWGLGWFGTAWIFCQCFVPRL